ncbi:HAD domain-containing protein [Kitasatospora mediocidica]|uniref:HAD domain-containing protein n=1 Tax=Kitasatospora mediocidica TaxID=58352 RepID=UPI0007C6B0BA|nr:HAD domain-containing protein [Kitasatospora mediocidica]
MTVNPASARPLLLLDVDGPLNPYAAMPDGRPEGYQEYRLMPPSWEAAERKRLSTWGRPTMRPVPLPVWLNPDHGPALSALPFDLVWATTWEAEANTFIAPILGLPELPFITWTSSRTTPSKGLFWKTPEIASWAQGRPFAWLDDELGDADRTWLTDHHPGPALLHRIDPQIGLRPTDLATLKSWAACLPKKHAAAPPGSGGAAVGADRDQDAK